MRVTELELLGDKERDWGSWVGGLRIQGWDTGECWAEGVGSAGSAGRQDWGQAGWKGWNGEHEWWDPVWA